MQRASTPQVEKTSGYLPTLDGWRAIAVIGVISFHTTVANDDIRASFAWNFLRFGRFGVDLFFAISGFLITTRLLQEQSASKRTGRTVNLGSFYARRAFRILPPALLLLTFLGGRVLFGTFAPSQSEWLGCLFFYRNYVSDGNVSTEHL